MKALRPIAAALLAASIGASAASLDPRAVVSPPPTNTYTWSATATWAKWSGETRLYVGTNCGGWVTNFTSKSGTNLSFTVQNWNADWDTCIEVQAVDTAGQLSDFSAPGVWWMPPPATNVLLYGLLPGAPIRTGVVNGAWSRMTIATGSPMVFRISNMPRFLNFRSTNDISITKQ